MESVGATPAGSRGVFSEAATRWRRLRKAKCAASWPLGVGQHPQSFGPRLALGCGTPAAVESGRQLTLSLPLWPLKSESVSGGAEGNAFTQERRGQGGRRGSGPFVLEQ